MCFRWVGRSSVPFYISHNITSSIMCSRFAILISMVVIMQAATGVHATPCFDEKSWNGLVRDCPSPYYEHPTLGCIFYQKQLMSHSDAIQSCSQMDIPGHMLDVHLNSDLVPASHITGDNIGIWTGPVYYNNGTVAPNMGDAVDSFVLNWGFGFPDNSSTLTCITGYRFPGFAMQQWNYGCDGPYPFFCQINAEELIGSK